MPIAATAPTPMPPTPPLPQLPARGARARRRTIPLPAVRSPLANPAALVLINAALVLAYLTAVDMPTTVARAAYGLLALGTLIACAVASIATALPMLLSLLIYAPVSDTLVGLPVYGIRGVEVVACGLLAVRYGRPNLPSLLLAGFAGIHLFKFLADTSVREHLYWSMQAFAGTLLAALFVGLSGIPSALRRLWLVAVAALTGVLTLCIITGFLSGEDFPSLFFTARRLGLLDGTSSNSLAFLTGSGLLWVLLARTSLTARAASAIGALFFALATYTTKSLGVMVFAFALWFLISVSMVRTWKGRLPYVLGALLAAMAAWERFPALLDESIDIDAKDITTLNSRTIVWDRCFGIIREQPLVGIDFDEYEAGGLSVTYLLRSGDVQEAVLTPHNAFLGAFTFGGLVGGGAFLAFHLVILVPRMRHIRTRGPAWRATVGMSLFAIAAHMVMDTWFTYYYFLAALPLTLGTRQPPGASTDTKPA